MSRKSKSKKQIKAKETKKMEENRDFIGTLQSFLITRMLAYILILFLFIGITVSVFFIAYAGKIYPGVSVLGITIGGKSPDEAIFILKRSLLPRFPKQIDMRFQDRSFYIQTASISASLDTEATGKHAFRFGRKGTVAGNSQAILEALFRGVDLKASVTLDKEALKHTIASIAAEIDVPAEEPAIQIAKSNKNSSVVEISTGRNGRRLNTNHTINQIQHQFEILSHDPIALRVEDLLVQTSQDQQESAKKRAEIFLTKSLTITAGEEHISIGKEELVPFIDIRNGFDRHKIASWAATIATKVNRSAQDAMFQFKNGKVTAFRPSKDGIALDEEKATQTIINTLSDLETTDSAKLAVTVPVKKALPKITTAEVNNLGIKELLGRGVSYFRGSSPERIHNITLLASRINGTLVGPGDTFSVASTVGDISAATGYKQAYIIQNGRTVLGDGGGTCQPSTTLFRAALNSGLPIKERHPHAYRVSYYEQGGFKPGLDATIFLPQVDLKFKNDTPSYILIQARVNQNQYQVVFEIYGTNDGRTVYISPVRTWDQSPPPPSLYQDDPTLPKGTIKQVDFAAGGLKTAFDYKVTKNGQIIQEKTFYSNFRPWQAVYLRGTK